MSCAAVGAALGVVLSVAFGSVPGTPWALPAAGSIVGLVAGPRWWTKLAAARWVRITLGIVGMVLVLAAAVFVMAAVGLSRMD